MMPNSEKHLGQILLKKKENQYISVVTSNNLLLASKAFDF